jgi:hypothetical protein
VSAEPLPAHARRVLDLLDGVRGTPSGWDARCPNQEHGRDGDDQHPSLRVSVTDEGVVLLKCRVGCPTDVVLGAIGLSFEDLFPPDGEPAEESQAVTVVPPATDLPVPVEADLKDRCYGLLLASLALSEAHRDDLRRRGLPDHDIEFRGYRSLRNVDRGRAARAVVEAVGEAALAVPGFATGAFGLTLAGESTGLLVPVRDVAGRVVALKVRRASDPKYVYLSSSPDGTSPGSPVHVPRGVRGPAPVVRLTEGELKADVCVARDPIPTVGVPGVSQWRQAVPVLAELKSKTVILSFDSPDVKTKPPVYEQTEDCWRHLCDAGFAVELEDW